MKKVIIIEDELILAMVNKQIIENLGFIVIGTVSNGEDAVSMVKKLSPDLLLMDIMIDGDIDGIEAMQVIRSFSDVPVIYVTGNSDPRAIARAEETDYIAFLTKPLDKKQLKEALDRIASGR